MNPTAVLESQTSGFELFSHRQCVESRKRKSPISLLEIWGLPTSGQGKEEEEEGGHWITSSLLTKWNTRNISEYIWFPIYKLGWFLLPENAKLTSLLYVILHLDVDYYFDVGSWTLNRGLWFPSLAFPVTEVCLRPCTSVDKRSLMMFIAPPPHSILVGESVIKVGWSSPREAAELHS